MKKTLYVIAMIIAAVVLVVIITARQWFPIFRDRGHAHGENLNRMRQIHLWIDHSATWNAESFAATVGTGLVTTASQLPSSIIAGFPIRTNEDYWKRDIWRRDYNVTITPLTNSAAGGLSFQVLVWRS